MLSRPLTSPSLRINGLSTRTSHIHNKTSMSDNEAVPLVGSDPETTRLLPRRQCRRRVRIQGQLAIVRTVSVSNLQQAKNGNGTGRLSTDHKDVRGSPLRRQDSYDGSEAEDEEDGDDVAKRDAQFRGYGIGGAGNIRRPIDVVGAPTSTSPSLLSLIHPSPLSPAPSLSTTKPSKLRSRIASLLCNLRGYKRSKGSARDQ
ncbi:hypothetical protein F5X98DRAFT_43853 [Xylaria grammica]|nr:hypothetical protein F5X98DRAFT_43853 [Xylaria grammica]